MNRTHFLGFAAFAALIIVLAATPAGAATLNVPADYATIQAAIDAAWDGDEIIVSPGTYVEDINFFGKNIILRSTNPTNPDIVSSTIIDGDRKGSVVTFSGTENKSCAFSGFTITNGYVYVSDGGGICGNGTLATIRNNNISGNYGDSGGGLSCCDGTIESNNISGNGASCGGGLYWCNGTIQNNIISGNWTCNGNGGGLYYCNGTIQNNTIFDNIADWGGGGLFECHGTIQNNTIYGNSDDWCGGGLCGCHGGTIRNCIIWQNNAGHGAQFDYCAIPSYSCIQNWTYGGTGNISSDPQLVDPEGGDFHLQPDSPCIDAGDSSPQFNDSDGSRNDMGAYGGPYIPLTVFDDVPVGFWARSEIEALYYAGIVHGYSENPPLYGPDILVSRDQMAVFIQRAKSLPLYTGPQIFDDVPPDHWAYDQIGALYQAGIVEGYSPTEYRPEVICARDQMAVFIQRAKNLPLYTGPQIFDDVSPDYWAYGEIGALYQAGIVKGYTETEYRPSISVDRAQMAVYIYRAFLEDNPSYVYAGAVEIENIPPALNSIGNKTVNEGSLLQFTISATDANNDSLAYSATGLPGGATFSGRTFSWKPTYSQVGTYNVTFTVKDSRGDSDSETIIIAVNNVNRAPEVGTISPSSGTSKPGQLVTFTTTYSDPDGWKNIKYVHLLFNTTVNGSNCFYGYYNQNTNKLYLRNDDNTAWLGGYAPGTSKTIYNSYAVLDCAKTTVSGNGKTLTVKWAIIFKGAFAGTKNSYLYVRDDSNLYSGWKKKGTWQIIKGPYYGPRYPYR